MFVRRLVIGGIALAALTLMNSVAFTQTLPNHADTSAREQLLDLAAVQNMRFLTTTDFPPFNYRDETGTLVGFHIDLAKAICTELNLVCTIQSWPWEQAVDALAGNQGDAMISGLAISPETGAQFDFSNIYLTFPARFVVQNTSKNTFNPAHAAAKVIAVRAGSRHADFAKKFLPEAILLEFDTEFAALEAVRDATANAYFGDAMRASFWLNDHNECCGFIGDAYFKTDYFGEGLAIAIPKGRDAIRTAIDIGMARLEKKGKLEELYLRWFPVSFY